MQTLVNFQEFSRNSKQQNVFKSGAISVYSAFLFGFVLLVLCLQELAGEIQESSGSVLSGSVSGCVGFLLSKGMLSMYFYNDFLTGEGKEVFS